MPRIRTPFPNNNTIAAEWDLISPQRQKAIIEKQDKTYEEVIKPLLIKLIPSKNYSRLLDAGCGTGDMSILLTKYAEFVEGIDISSRSIETAKKINYSQNIEYFNFSIEDYGSMKPNCFDVVVASMVLMDAPNLPSIINSIYKCLRDDGICCITLLHPAFWYLHRDMKRDYLSEFHDMQEIKIETSAKKILSIVIFIGL
ncbi:MAG: class I SAM-dependent methyltransferase [Rhodomicrobium sp.]|nr:class I SAM-dependent methyltransferase [Rhodomicrobium sp.]